MPEARVAGTEIGYLYRDGGNYKFRSSIRVAGYLTRIDISEYMIDAEYFIPEQVCLESLVPAIRNDDDHKFHEIEDFSYADFPAPILDKDELISRFQAASNKGWLGA